MGEIFGNVVMLYFLVGVWCCCCGVLMLGEGFYWWVGVYEVVVVVGLIDLMYWWLVFVGDEGVYWVCGFFLCVCVRLFFCDE